MQIKKILGFFNGVNKVQAPEVAAAQPVAPVGHTLTTPNAFTSPLQDTTIHAGQSMELSWENPSGPTVALTLVHGDPANLQQVAVIANDTPNQGSVYWRVPETLAPGQYAVKLQSSDGQLNFSPMFTIYDPVSPWR